MNAERMTPEDWAQINDAYSAQFLPLINPERNVLAAVVDLHRHVTQAPLTITDDYTLKATDHGRIIFMDDGGNIVIPEGLPDYFQASLRNISGDNLTVTAANARVTISGINGTVLTSSVDFLLLEAGWADLVASAANTFWLNGHVEGI